MTDRRELMLLTMRRKPFDDEGWVYEFKYDGYRLVAEIWDGAVQLWSRNGTDATTWYPETTSAMVP